MPDTQPICALTTMACIDPFKKNASADDAATLVQRIVDKTNLPVMVSGCGNVERDIEVLTVVC